MRDARPDGVKHQGVLYELQEFRRQLETLLWRGGGHQREPLEIHVIIEQIVVDRIVLPGMNLQQQLRQEGAQQLQVHRRVTQHLPIQLIRHLLQFVRHLVHTRIAGQHDA